MAVEITDNPSEERFEIRDDGLEVLPFCPFVRSWIEGHPEYVDLVPADRRKAFDLRGP